MKTDLLLQRAESYLLYKAMLHNDPLFGLNGWQATVHGHTSHLQNKTIYARLTAKSEKETGGKWGEEWKLEISVFWDVPPSSILKTEAANASETYLPIYHTTRL
jgi:hypothetical protein